MRFRQKKIISSLNEINENDRWDFSEKGPRSANEDANYWCMNEMQTVITPTSQIVIYVEKTMSFWLYGTNGVYTVRVKRKEICCNYQFK